MPVTVKYFASLRELLERSEEEVVLGPDATVGGLWAQVSAGQALPPNTRAAINHEYVEPDHPVREGDEVAFFPPVTGG